VATNPRGVAVPLLIASCLVLSGTHFLSAVKLEQRQGTPPAPRTPAVLVGGFVEAEPLSMSTLVHTAQEIFTAKITDVGEEKRNGLYFAKITLAKVRIIKGSQDSTLVVYQDPGAKSPVQINDRVLWFLSDASDIGLSMPVGYASGHFTLCDGDLIHGSFRNLFSNKGLWDESFWLKIRDAVKYRLIHDSDLAISDPRSLEELLEHGSDPSKGALPLDLLIAVVRVLDARGSN
jgi:hypothetical protein